MQNSNKQKVLLVVLGTYFLCYAFRIFEYFVLRTDQTLIGEAIVHKLLGIGVLFLVTFWQKLSLSEIGFVKEKVFVNLIKGFAFGCGVFVIAYGVEILILVLNGSFESLKLFVSSYAIDQNNGNRTEFFFFLICILGNIVNVVMEEGIFRGLFVKILEKKYSFLASILLSAVLFGFWHMIGPIRNFFDGSMSFSGMIANICMLVATSTLVAIKFSMLTKITGSLYMSMADHFVNNTIVNLLHVVSSSGTDQLMVVRISIAQSVSFILVLIYYIRFINQKKSCHPC